MQQQTNGVVASVDDFDTFVFGLTDPNEQGVLNGTHIILREWYHSRLVVQHGWPAMEMRDELDRAWRDAVTVFSLQES